MTICHSDDVETIMKDSEEPPSLYLLAFLPLLSVDGGVFSAFALLAVLLLFSALVSGSEVAFFSLTKEELRQLKDSGTRGDLVIQLRQQPRKLLGTILVANNFINIAIVVLSEYIVWNFFSIQLFEQWGSWLSANAFNQMIGGQALSRLLNFTFTVFGITFLLVLFGEIAPKIYAKIHNRTMATFMSRPLAVLMRILSPVTSSLVALSNVIEDKLQRSTNSKSASKEDLDKAIELAVDEEEDSKEEADILRGIVKFNEVTVKQISRNRVDVTSIDIDSDYKEVMNIVETSGYSRLPVYRDDFDNIVGILYVKDLIEHLDEAKTFEWQNLIHTETLYVPETKKINDLMKEFQEKRTHMAIVVDEYGGSSGIVTLEDVMEEVIGEIKDEKDLEEEFDYTKVDEQTYIFDGKTQINDVCRIMDIDVDDFSSLRGEADTIAGLILENHGLIPKRDQDFNITDRYLLKVISVNKRRIERVKVSILEP